MKKDGVKELRRREREEGESGRDREEVCVCRGGYPCGGKKTTKVNSPPGFT